MTVDLKSNMIIGTWNGLYILPLDHASGNVVFGNVPHHLMDSVIHSVNLTETPSILLISHTFAHQDSSHQLIFYDFERSIILTKLCTESLISHIVPVARNTYLGKH